LRNSALLAYPKHCKGKTLVNSPVIAPITKSRTCYEKLGKQLAT